jgi:transposase
MRSTGTPWVKSKDGCSSLLQLLDPEEAHNVHRHQRVLVQVAAVQVARVAEPGVAAIRHNDGRPVLAVDRRPSHLAVAGQNRQECMAGGAAIARLFWLSDEAWSMVELHLRRGKRDRPRVDDKRVISGILHVLKTGCRWRDVSPAYGPPTTVYSRYNRWSQRGLWARLFERVAASGDVPTELMIDSTHVKAHRSATGGKGGSGRKEAGAHGRPYLENPSPGR